MTTFTSSLPEDLLKLLDLKAKELKLSKNKLIEKALRIYLDQLNKAAYIKSYKKLGKDEDLMQIAAEGMEEYLSEINTTEDDENR